MPDYQQSKIYKLVCSETNKIYIGSTTQKLNRRRSNHIRQKNKCSSVSLINPTIHLLEDYPCNTKRELEEKERYFIDNNDCVNKTIPTRTMKEWKESNKDKISIHNKTYKLKNKSKLDEYNKTLIPCSCGLKIQRQNMIPHLKTKKHLKRLESIN